MGTSAPAVKTHDIPITEPYQPPAQIPAANPDRWITPIPVTVPAREPVPIRRTTTVPEREVQT